MAHGSSHFGSWMSFPAAIRSHLDVVDTCFDRRTPASLSLALDALADDLKRPRDRKLAQSAIAELRLAARAAFPGGDLDRARDHYCAALSSLAQPAQS
jgi:hypothetical protein